jgi:two-component sensor histidine kinase
MPSAQRPSASPAAGLTAWQLALIWLLLAGFIGAIWHGSNAAYRDALLRERGRELLAIAALKIEFVRIWLQERRSDAALMSHRAAIVQALARRPAGTDFSGDAALAGLLREARDLYDYDAIHLVGADGKVIAAAPEETPRHADAVSMAKAAVGTGGIVVASSGPDDAGDRPLVEIAAPVLAGGRAQGATVLCVSPRRRLDALFALWPAPNVSGETFLFESRNGRIAYLTGLRHADAQQLRRRADEPSLPAAMAARGEQGMAEGIDYRGASVLAAIGQVPGMPWYVVAKLDRDEIMAPARRQALWSGALAALLALSLGLAMLFAWRRNRSELELARQTAALAAVRAQRDAVVREVHHRIKNHLQGLAGLLRQQVARRAELRPQIEECAAQINAIAVVHGLQGHDNSGRIGLRGLVADVADSLHGITGLAIELQPAPGQCFRAGPCQPTDACRWSVRHEEAVPLALVLNELFTNALRHGDDAAPPVFDLRCEDSGAKLVLHNRGRLPEGLDFSAGKGLGTGLTLVRSLLPAEGIAVGLANAGDGRVETTLSIAPPVLAGPAPVATGNQADSRR